MFCALRGADIHPSWAWVAVSPALVLMMAGPGFGVIISALTTKYRDLRFLAMFGGQLLMYATLMIYPASAIPERFQWLILANPLMPIVEAFRYAFLGAGTLEAGRLLYSLAFMVGAVVVGSLVFNRVEATFMDTV